MNLADFFLPILSLVNVTLSVIGTSFVVPAIFKKTAFNEKWFVFSCVGLFLVLQMAFWIVLSPISVMIFGNIAGNYNQVQPNNSEDAIAAGFTFWIEILVITYATFFIQVALAAIGVWFAAALTRRRMIGAEKSKYLIVKTAAAYYVLLIVIYFGFRALF